MRRAHYLKIAFLSSSLIFISPLASATTCVCQSAKKPAINGNFIIPKKNNPSWYIDAGLGWVFNQKLKTNYLANLDPVPADQYNSPEVKQIPGGFLSGGYVWSRQTEWFPFTSLGLEYSYVMPAEVKGVIEEFSDPEDANFIYKYKVAHQNLRLQAKLNVYRYKNWMPYFSGGVGASWNKFSHYNEAVLQDSESDRPNPAFSKQTKLNFSYNLGTGVDYIFTENLWGGLGYRYDQYGWMQTGYAKNNFFPDESLKDTLHSHTILLTLRYLFA